MHTENSQVLLATLELGTGKENSRAPPMKMLSDAIATDTNRGPPRERLR